MASLSDTSPPTAGAVGMSTRRNQPITGALSQDHDNEKDPLASSSGSRSGQNPAGLPGIRSRKAHVVQVAAQGDSATHHTAPLTVQEVIQGRLAMFREAMNQQIDLLSQELLFAGVDGLMRESAASLDRDGFATQRKSKPEDMVHEWPRRSAGFTGCHEVLKTGADAETDSASVAPKPGPPHEEPLNLSAPRCAWHGELPSSSTMSKDSSSRRPRGVKTVYDIEDRLQNELIDRVGLRSQEPWKTPIHSTQGCLPAQSPSGVLGVHSLGAQLGAAREIQVHSPHLPLDRPELHDASVNGCARQGCSDPIIYGKRDMSCEVLQVLPAKSPDVELRSQDNESDVEPSSDLILASDTWRERVATFPIQACGLLLRSPRTLRNLEAVQKGWRALVHQSIILVIAIACLIACAWHIVSKESVPHVMTISSSHAADLAFAVGSVVGLASVGAFLRGDLIVDMYSVLRTYIARHGILKVWVDTLFKDSLVTLGMWCAAVTWRANFDSLGRATHDEPSAQGATSVLVFVVSTGILMSLATLILHMSRAMVFIVDGFCARLSSQPDINLVEAANVWNVTQALLRKSCKIIEACFLTVQTTIFAAVVAMSAELWLSKVAVWTGVARFVPTLVICLAVIRVLFAAADVTSKCSRVPTLVNTTRTGRQVSAEHHHFVAFVTTCEAGLYMCEVRVTSYMVLKFIYMLLALCFAVAYRLVDD